MRSNDGFDDGGEIVNIGEGFYTEEDVIEGLFEVIARFFGRSDG